HQRPSVSRRPADARPPRRARADRPVHAPLDVRHRHPLRRDQAPRPRGCRLMPGSLSAPDLVLAMTGASGAPYAVRLLQVLCRSGRTLHLTISPSGSQVLREELGIEVDLNRLDPSAFGDLGAGRLIYHHHADFSAGIASGSFPTGGMVVAPC